MKIAKAPFRQSRRILTSIANPQWDDWVPQDRVRKFTEENKELAAQLHHQLKAIRQPALGKPGKFGGKGGRANGSDFSSARGSEERHASVAAQSGRGGPRRNRDYDLEQVSSLLQFLFVRFVSFTLLLYSVYLLSCFWRALGESISSARLQRLLKDIHQNPGEW